jgi:TolB-like protein
MPFELQRVVYKCLSKDRLKRYQSCSEVIQDLEAAKAALTATTGTPDSQTSKRQMPGGDLRRSIEEASKSSFNMQAQPSPMRWVIGAVVLAAIVLIVAGLAWFVTRRNLREPPPSSTVNSVSPANQVKILAVLPFPPVVGDKRLTALGQGLTESVGAKLSSLADNRWLEVIPARNLQEKGLTSLSDASRQFGANVGLSVHLEQTGDLVRFSYSLMNAQSGNLLGGDSVTVPAADVFSVEDNVAAGAVKALQIKLRPEDESTLKVHGTTVPAAYNYYLQARGYSRT